MKQDFNFIIPEEKAFDKDVVMPASYIRKTFEVSKGIKKITLITFFPSCNLSVIS